MQNPGGVFSPYPPGGLCSLNALGAVGVLYNLQQSVGVTLIRDRSTTLQGRSKGNPFPQKRLVTPAPGRLGLVLFCWLRFRSVWAGYGVERCGQTLQYSYRPVSLVGWPSNVRSYLKKPSGGKAPSHLRAHSPSRWMAPPRRVSFLKVFPRVL